MKPYGKAGKEVNCCPAHDSTSKAQAGRSLAKRARQQGESALRQELANYPHIHRSLTSSPLFQNEEHRHHYQALVKADTDAWYFFSLGQKEDAFKVLQERVYPNQKWLEEREYVRPRLISRARE